MMTGRNLILGSGAVVDDPVRVASRMMSEEWPYYDGLPQGDPDRIEPIDVLATVSVNSFVNNAASVRRIHRGVATACDDLMRAIPRDAALLETDLALVEQLIDAACSVQGVLVPVATKVLHRKRPGLVPMLDNVLLRYYFEHLERPELTGRSQDRKKAASVARLALDEFKSDLEKARPDLDAIAAELGGKGMPVTTVRLLELLLWCAVEPTGYYR
jgi:hypothetical protein